MSRMSSPVLGPASSPENPPMPHIVVCNYLPFLKSFLLGTVKVIFHDKEKK
jgi:hypothetical protein